MKEEFILFLKRKRILTKFKKNLDPIYIPDKDFDHYFKASFPALYIGDAFSWVEAPEGYGFWDKIDDDWKEYLSTGKTNK